MLFGIFYEHQLPRPWREEARQRRKAGELAPYVAQALTRTLPLEPVAEVPPVDAYPVAMQKLGVDMEQLMEEQGRSLATQFHELRTRGMA